ncbi:hypothetical protein HMPREF1990_01859 [Porphyromonas gingivalis W4087]|nr:hypothetical protein HMPREF1553_01004 [Porphyromonas gingivalis F0568]ERJ87166.1 hypothetical protein HMPREF1990_01859 [Porphyromonas gingivalis W4087]
MLKENPTRFCCSPTRFYYDLTDQEAFRILETDLFCRNICVIPVCH